MSGPSDTMLRIQAHEADLVRGPRAVAAVRSLEVMRCEENGRVVLEPGDGLIRWAGGGTHAEEDDFAEDHFQLGSSDQIETKAAGQDGTEGTWVDR
ncbi:hypothetical protein ACG7TL_008177 [Trametes sanguinea]